MAKKELKVKEEKLPSTDLMEWGETDISTKDMVIPKILPLQQMSEKVINKEGEYGEFRDTLSNNKFGDLNTPFEVIPFHMQKKWMEFELVPQKNGSFKREYIGTIPCDHTNDDLSLSEEVSGKKIERDRVMDFFCLIPSEVESGEALPYVLSFRRTSLKCGQKLATQIFVKNRAAGKSPASVVMEMSGKSTSNDDGTFIVQDVKPKRASTEKEVAEALKWFKIIRTNGAKVDESDIKEAKVVKEETEF